MVVLCQALLRDLSVLSAAEVDDERSTLQEGFDARLRMMEVQHTAAIEV